ncbi:MAG: Ig-like domain-containing protein [Pseudomonadota bacterium]
MTHWKRLCSRAFVSVCLLGTASLVSADITITGSFNRTAAEWESGTLTTNAFLANNGPGTLIVDGGSELNLLGNTNLFGTGQVIPPNEANVTITDAGSLIFTVNGLTIGNNRGVGTVSILNGARLQTTERVELGGGGNLGDASTSSGSVTVDGPGSAWEANGGINVGQFARGSLTIQNEAGVTAEELFVARGENATGSLTMLGDGSFGSSRLFLNDTLSIGDGGMALIMDGAEADAGLVLSVRGIATVQGDTTLITASDRTDISSANGAATLTLESGAQGMTDRTILGGDTGEGSANSGTLTVQGTGSTWSSTQGIAIGTAFGDGTLNILDGATATVVNAAQNVRVRNGSLNLQNAALVAGQVDATGPATVEIESGTVRLIGDQAALFNGFDAGDVNINGGSLTIDTQGFTVATSVELSGSGGLIKQGTGSLELTAANFYAGETVVAGGSLLVNNTTGSATGNSTVNVNSGAILGGEGSIIGSVNNMGIVAPGNSAGTLTINDYSQQAGGTLLLELGGTMPSVEFDVLQINGPANLNGTIEVQLINGYVPAPGDQFTLITSPDITNDGVNFTLPTLPADRGWDVILDTNSLRLEVISINVPPVADNQTVSINEDTVDLITMTGSDLNGQSLDFSIATGPSNGSLGFIKQFSDTSAEVLYTPDPDFNGSDSFTFFVNDGFEDSAVAIVTINVEPVNDQPTFTASDPVPINEDSPIFLPNWATFDPGPQNEVGQGIEAWSVSNVSNPDLFLGGAPGLTNTGDLTIILESNASGTSTFDVTVRDTGGTENDGVDTSAPLTFTVTVNPVNDAPSFVANGDVIEIEDRSYSEPWANTISPGPADEIGQSVVFLTTVTSNPGLFATAPSVDDTGTLSFVPAADTQGSATVEVIAMDDGGDANGGVDVSGPVTLTIEIIAATDLTIDKTSGSFFIDPGGPVQYTIVVTNTGPSDVTGATVIDIPPIRLGNVSWTCAPTGSASCNPSGTDLINELVDLAEGSSVTYTLDATLLDSINEPITNTANVIRPDGIVELNPFNNEDSDTDVVSLFADGMESEEP